MRRWIQNDVSNFEWKSNHRTLKIAQRIEIRKYKKDFLETILGNEEERKAQEVESREQRSFKNLAMKNALEMEEEGF